MITVIGVRFRTAGKIYYFNPENVVYNDGENIIVETARGIEYGEVVIVNRKVDKKEIKPPLKKVIRKATKHDKKKLERNRKEEKEAFGICKKKIKKHKLDMKLVGVEYTFDKNKLLFYFTSDDRVDFRELVKDLASVFKTRIELRQIGVRDETKICGGIGICGRELCCNTFLSEFEPVSIKMAKDQDLSLNPSKISGICGRLMCCLTYEEESYKEMKKTLPKIGEIVMTPEGEGKTLFVNALRERVKVAVEKKEKGRNIREAVTFHVSELERIKKNNIKGKKHGKR